MTTKGGTKLQLTRLRLAITGLQNRRDENVILVRIRDFPAC